MSSKQFLSLCDLSFELPHKTCFEGFHGVVHEGDRIVLIGDNGSGKTSLMKMLVGLDDSQSGRISVSEGTRIGYMPQDFHESEELTVWQIATLPVKSELEGVQKLETMDPEEDPSAYEQLLEELIAKEAFSVESHIEIVLDQMQLSDKRDCRYRSLSGGERMRLKVAKLLAMDPDLILLDEPTNHLDVETRRWLFDFLSAWKGAAVVITHDYDLLHVWPTKVWSIAKGKVETFDGMYDDYLHHCEVEKEKRESYRQELLQKRKVLVRKSQAEETRRARTKQQGKKKYYGDPLLAKGKAEKAENNMGRAHIKRNSEEQEKIHKELKELNEPRKVAPRFYTDKSQPYHFYLKVENGAVGYGEKTILSSVNFSLGTGERVAISGANGSGKTTLFKALMGSEEVKTDGQWEVPSSFNKQVGHLDQHHKNLKGNRTILEHLLEKRPDWKEEKLKSHLHAFLFYDRRTWQQEVTTLSEGEKMRLSLALIAADSPGVLFLDEVSNHLDLSTKEHLVEVLQTYEGALVVSSHEEGFLKQLSIDKIYEVEEFR